MALGKNTTHTLKHVIDEQVVDICSMSCMRITTGPIRLLKKNRELRTTMTYHEKFTQGYSKFVPSSYTAKYPEKKKSERPRYGTGSLSPHKTKKHHCLSKV